VSNKKLLLPVVSDVERSLRVSVKARPGVTRVSQNSFALLPVENCEN
jgi:hypothetical protein